MEEQYNTLQTLREIYLTGLTKLIFYCIIYCGRILHDWKFLGGSGLGTNIIWSRQTRIRNQEK